MAEPASPSTTRPGPRSLIHRAVLGLGLASLLISACAPPAGADKTVDGDLAVRRGTFAERYLLTGELVAGEAERLTVPRFPGWQVQIRWMEEDGAEVEAGQKVLELDNSNFSGDLEDKRLAAVEADNLLERAQAEAAAAAADKELTVEQRRAEMAKARLRASVPEDLLPAREYQERQLALRNAELALAKAEEELAATREAKELDVEMRRIERAKTRREIETAEEAIESLSLNAPTSGVLIVEEHPWEERKLQVGDTVWVGMPVMQIPDLGSMEVEAVLSDVDEGRVRVGQRAVVTPDAFPERRIPGVVTEVAPVAREVEGASLRRNFQVRLELAEVDPSWMRPGMSVKVEVEGTPAEDVLIAPRAALDPGSDPPRAFLAGGGTAEVRLGRCNPSHCIVEEGLEEGQRLAAAFGSSTREAS